MNQFFKQISPGGQLLALLLILVVFFILGTGVAIVTVEMGDSNMDLLSQALSQIIVFGGAALFWGYMIHGNMLQYMKFGKPQPNWKSILVALLCLLLILPASDWLSIVNDKLHFPNSLNDVEQLLRRIGNNSQYIMESYLLRGGVGDLIINIIVLAVVPAFCEELFFRGALQQTLDSCFRGKHHLAIWTTAAIFSLMHGEIFAFLPRLLLGLLLGYFFFYGRSIWLNIAAHFLNNLTVVIMYFLAAHGAIEVEMAESLGLPFIVVLATFGADLLLFKYFFITKTMPETEKGENQPEGI